MKRRQWDTTLYKLALAGLFPLTFQFAVSPAEGVGGTLLLAGIATALSRSREAK